MWSAAPPYLLLISILLPLPVRTQAIGRSSPPVVFALKTLHSAADVPKKVEKASSENTTFENSEHPYRTCGSSGCVFLFFGSSPMSVFPWKTIYFFLTFLFKSLIFWWLSHLRLFRLCFLPLRFLPYVSVPLENQWISQHSRSNLWFSCENQWRS